VTALYESRPSPIEGNGCFATTFIAAGTVVERFEGEVVTLADLDRIEAEGKYHSSLAIAEGRHLLLAVIDPRDSAVALEVGSGVGGFNHSCDSNLWHQDEVTIVARRDIAEGEELTLDYRLATDGPTWSMNCRCGAGVCRGTVSSADWRLPEVQQRYAGHFSPLLNKRIARLQASGAGGGRE
jgi:SET domain-containing protein